MGEHKLTVSTDSTRAHIRGLVVEMKTGKTCVPLCFLMAAVLMVTVRPLSSDGSGSQSYEPVSKSNRQSSESRREKRVQFKDLSSDSSSESERPRARPFANLRADVDLPSPKRAVNRRGRKTRSKIAIRKIRVNQQKERKKGVKLQRAERTERMDRSDSRLETQHGASSFSSGSEVELVSATELESEPEPVAVSAYPIEFDPEVAIAVAQAHPIEPAHEVQQTQQPPIAVSRELARGSQTGVVRGSQIEVVRGSQIGIAREAQQGSIPPPTPQQITAPRAPPASQEISPSNSYIFALRRNEYRANGGPQKVGRTISLKWSVTQRSRHEKRRRRRVDAITNGSEAVPSKTVAGQVTDPIGAGWWLFSFGAAGSMSTTSFKFVSTRTVVVTVVDMFCRGDSFGVYDGKRLVAQSSRTRPDRKCRNPAFSPQTALEDGRWAATVFELAPGPHELTIKTVDSPFGAGFAAIRFETVPLTNAPASTASIPRRFSRTKVCLGYNDFVVIKTPFAAADAHGACRSIKSELASVKDKQMLQAAFASVRECLGVNQSVWVNSKRGDGAADSVLSANGNGETGAVSAYLDGGRHPVLCKLPLATRQWAARSV